MVEINFMELYCQPAKNIFESTIFHCKNILKKQKNNERYSFAHTSFGQWHSGEGAGDKLRQTVLDAPSKLILKQKPCLKTLYFIEKKEAVKITSAWVAPPQPSLEIVDCGLRPQIPACSIINFLSASF